MQGHPSTVVSVHKFVALGTREILHRYIDVVHVLVGESADGVTIHSLVIECLTCHGVQGLGTSRRNLKLRGGSSISSSQLRCQSVAKNLNLDSDAGVNLIFI